VGPLEPGIAEVVGDAVELLPVTRFGGGGGKRRLSVNVGGGIKDGGEIHTKFQGKIPGNYPRRICKTENEIKFYSTVIP
jgi:hypothetical protein